MITSRLSQSKVLLGCFIFAILNLIEDFLLIKYQLVRYGDIYISTIFLAILIFLFFILKDSWNAPFWNLLKTIGHKYSTWIYILHILFIIFFDYFSLPSFLVNIFKALPPICIYVMTLFVIWIFQFICSLIKKGLKIMF